MHASLRGSGLGRPEQALGRFPLPASRFLLPASCFLLPASRSGQVTSVIPLATYVEVRPHDVMHSACGSFPSSPLTFSCRHPFRRKSLSYGRVCVRGLWCCRRGPTHTARLVDSRTLTCCKPSASERSAWHVRKRRAGCRSIPSANAHQEPSDDELASDWGGAERDGRQASPASPYSQRQGQRALGRDARGAVAHAASQRQPFQCHRRAAEREARPYSD